MRTLLKTLLISSLLTLTGSVIAAQPGAVESPGHGAAFFTEHAEAATLQCGGVSLSQAVEQVRRQYKGRIVSATTKVRGGCEVHVIKVLTEDGKVKTVEIQGQQRS